MKISVIEFFIFIVCIVSIFSSIALVVKVKNGKLRGTVMKSRYGRQFLAFRGIPYALPPVGHLRFEPSEPAASWTGVLSAEDDAGVCVQIAADKVIGTEDCLYLNVYTPELPNPESEQISADFPVMVWIHGGGWYMRSGQSAFYNPKFLLDHDIVLVTMNYRLGALGFLSTSDGVIPGNQGMKDQVLALRWVQENIGVFGGDRNQVTIFGNSAGGASAHFLMMSPLAKGLFRRAISQAGTTRHPWTFNTPEKAKRTSERLGRDLGCPTENSVELSTCLKKKDAVDIIRADQNWKLHSVYPIMPFRPVVEADHPGAFLTKEPAEYLRYGNLTDIPWLTGMNSHEGAMSVAPLFGAPEEKDLREFNDNFLDLAPIYMMYDETCPHYYLNEISKKIRKFYLDDKLIDERTRFKAIEMFQDVLIGIGLNTAIKEHLATLSSPVYYYHFAYRGSSSWSSVDGDSSRDYGVCHADEIQYLFPIGDVVFPNTTLTQEDHEIIDTVTTLWCNFAKTGNPTPEITPKLPVKWKPVEIDALEYLLIENPGKMRMSKNLLKDNLKFWESLPCAAALTPSSDAFLLKDEL